MSRGLETNLSEGCQGVDVVRMNLNQIIHEEEQKR